MASFFGEVLPVYSRTGEDDEDDELTFKLEKEKAPVIVRWSPDVRNEIADKNHVQCSDLVVALGQCGKAFKHSKVDKDMIRIGVIFNSVQRAGSLSQTCCNDNSCYVYRSADMKTCLVLCPVTIPDVQSLSWSQALLENFSKSVNTVIVSTSHVSEFKTSVPPSDLLVPFIVCLKTDKWTGKCSSTLPQPNIITGPAAQLLTYCEVQGIPACVYHLYRESQFMDNVALSGFMKLLKSLPVNNLRSDVDISKDSELISEESLYI